MPRTLLAFAIAALLAVAGGTSAAFAAGNITIADLQASARALGFLDSLPDDGTIVVGIVYSTRTPDAKALAIQAASSLAALPGPNNSVFRTRVLSIDDLVQGGGRLDAIILMTGLSADAAAISNAVRRRRLVSISSDPACLNAKSCVLMINTSRGVEIVLDTAMAEVVGATFSTVFTMMVKRR